MGAKVDEITAYETLPDDDKKEKLIDFLKKGKIDAVTFTSSSTVSNFISLLGSDRRTELLKNVVTASIGPITSKTARSYNIKPTIEAKDYTIQGLVDSLLSFYEN